jgi:hypothetical protein
VKKVTGDEINGAIGEPPLQWFAEDIDLNATAGL